MAFDLGRRPRVSATWVLTALGTRMLSATKLRAFSVHIFTASGSFLALLSLTAAAEQRWTAMFLWLGAALLVDGVDGPIARRLNVKEVLPNWSGDMLDNVIDYVTYVLIPAYALYASGLISEPLSFVAAGVIVVSSAIYYADTGMKTAENFFSGFPVVWNMVVFAFFVIQPPEWVVLLITFSAAFMSFLPVWFLHPVRVKRLRAVNLGVTALWTACCIVALLSNLEVGPVMQTLTALTSAYLFAIGAVMQIFPNLGRA